MRNLLKVTGKKLLFSLILLANAFCFAQENSSINIPLLLQEYLSNDVELQKLSIELEKNELNLKKSEINSGMSLSLSTGNMVLKKTEDGLRISVSPQASFSFPQNNTSVSVSSDPVYSTDDSFSLRNTGISFSTDIISNTNRENEIARLKTERSYLETKRSISNRALSAEKEFYSELKTLLSKAGDVLSSEQKVYDEELNVKTVKAQGYEESSANYRSADFKLRSAKRTYEGAKREFIRLKNNFAVKCNIEKTDTDFDEAWKFLPSEIAYVEPLNISSFDKELYSKIESAKWNQKIGELTRDRKNYSVKAKAGYTFDNSITDTNTVDAGVEFSKNGISAEAGVNVPVSVKDSGVSVLPSVTMKFSYQPQAVKLENISEQEKLLEIRSEEISIRTAYEDYEKNLVSTAADLEDLLWDRESKKEDLENCIESEKNMAQWFKQGIISEKDYLPETVNLEKAKINCLVNAVDFIIYNNNVKLLFCND